MGVNSLWDIVGPSARPVKLEALSRKKLAVDASIWVYQFMKAVRDTEGNSLHLSHVVGFFRRICKLLYFGIQPVFVFDGGAPALKRKTIQRRRERREGKREDSSETAHRVLAIQVLRQSRKNEEDLVYFNDLPNQHPKLVQPTQESGLKRFRPKDEYHLPDLKKIKVDENDERLLPEEEFRDLTQESFDIVDGIDINEVDPNSKEFSELPMPTQYMILSHLRLKSRLRMGYSKTQLEQIFPGSMDFSKFQIKQVQKRNFYTQRLMDVSGMGDAGNATRRVAGEKDRKYALVRVEDGWSLSLGDQEDDSHVEEKKFKDKNATSASPLVVTSHLEAVTPHPEKVSSHTEIIKVSDDSDSDDFEDVEIPDANDEAPEDREFNKAVLQSIYDQYKDNEGFSDLQLKTAIEQSKKEYNKIREQEQSGNKAEDLLGLDMGESVLFSEPSKNTGVKSSKSPGKTEILKSFKEENLKPQISVTKSDSEEELSKLENLIDISDTEEHDSKDTAAPRPTPEWFNEKLDESVYTRSRQEEDEEALDTEDVGLIPWDKAKEIIDAESVEEEIDEEEPSISKLEKYLDVSKEAEQASQPEVINLESDSEDKHLTESTQNNKMKVAQDDSPIINSAETIEQERNTVKNSQEEIKLTNENGKDVPKDKVQGPILDYIFVDDEDHMIDKQLQQELGDHEKLKQVISATSNQAMNFSTSISEEQLLRERLLKQKREADEVTQTMINDVQELLRRFGIPFLTAPMEAEAQCVELLKLGLVDGIVTDDSDTFLFGGDRVYKNMFNQKQFVECYIKEDISGKLGLNQYRFIELGLLLGSDYTDGIKGIGPVLAVEILAEFGTLENFKKWFDECSLRGKMDASSSLKKSLLNKIKNNKLFLPLLFPDKVVFDAYVNPEVDKSEEPLKWGVPDLDQIRSFLMSNVGWSQARVDEVMVPLIRDMNRRLREGTQSTIGEFFLSSYVQSQKELQLESISRITSIFESAKDMAIEAAVSASSRSTDTPVSQRPQEIKNLLDSRVERDILKGMKHIITMMSRGEDVLDYFADIVKNITSSNPKVRDLVLIYLTRYAEVEPDKALLAINSIQRLLDDKSSVTRANAIKALSGIRIVSLSPILLVCVKRTVNDRSPLVRATTSMAISKIYEIDQSNKKQLLEYLDKLLADSDTSVVAASIKAYLKIWNSIGTSLKKWTPIHGHFRRFCNLLKEFDEWTQSLVIDLLTEYSRLFLPKPKLHLEDGRVIDLPEDFSDITEVDYEVSYDDDLYLFLNAVKSLVYSDTHFVILSVVKALLALGSPRILRDYDIAATLCGMVANSVDPLNQFLALQVISVCLQKDGKIFSPFYRKFYIFPSDSVEIAKQKLSILSALVDETNIKNIIDELRYNALNASDSSIACDSIEAIGYCSSVSTEWNNKILKWCLKNIRSTRGNALNKLLTVVRYIIQLRQQRDTARNQEISKIVYNLSLILYDDQFALEEDAKACIIWLIGEFTSESNNNIAPDVIRHLLKTFSHEATKVRYQTLMLAAKVYSVTIDELTKNNTNSEALSKEYLETNIISRMFQHVLTLSKYDSSYDTRDKARMLHVLLTFGSEHSELASLFLQVPKPPPHFSSIVHNAGQNRLLLEFLDVPPWGEQSKLPPSTIRKEILVVENSLASGSGVSSSAISKKIGELPISSVAISSHQYHNGAAKVAPKTAYQLQSLDEFFGSDGLEEDELEELQSSLEESSSEEEVSSENEASEESSDDSEEDVLEDLDESLGDELIPKSQSK